MRTALLASIGLLWLLLAGACLPLIDETQRTPVPGTQLAIAIISPSAAETVTPGRLITIKWTAANLTGEPAIVSIVLESRSDLSRTTLLEDLPLDGTGGSGEYVWDTTRFSGPYSIIVTVQTPDASDEDVSAGLITVTPPAGS